MKLPRDVSGATLVAALGRMGYERVRQRGSHVRITTQECGEHHEVIPLHDPIRAKTHQSRTEGQDTALTNLSNTPALVEPCNSDTKKVLTTA